MITDPTRAVIEAARVLVREVYGLSHGVVSESSVEECAIDVESALSALASAPPPEPLPMAVRVLEDIATAAEAGARYMREHAQRTEGHTTRHALVRQAKDDHETARQCRLAIERLR
jgi:hypothetical protein